MDERLDEKLKKVIIAVVCLIVVALGLVFGLGDNSKSVDLPEDCEVEIIFDDYSAQNGLVTFDCKIYLGNNSSEDKYYKISGDFRTEYNAEMIDERVLPCYDRETGFTVFFVPAQTEGIFEVSFSSTGDDSVKKPDRLEPDLVVEEVSETLVENDEFAKNDVYLGLNGNSDVYYNQG